MGQQAGAALMIIFVFILAVVILVLLIRGSHILWQPRSTDPQVRLLGHYSPLLTWLKYRRLARMELQPQGRTKIRTTLATLAELAIVVAWALWVGRNYLITASNMWLHEDWMLNVQAYFNWSLLGKCGACVFWNGSFNGGAPLLIDLIAAMIHPLAVLLVLLAGAINGSKLIAVTGLVMAGLAQWWLAKEMRLGLAARMWGALLAVVGGHLIGRLQAGLTEMIFSTASASLVIPAALRLARTGERRMAAVTGILFGLALLSGQGYMQLALCLAVCPALLILIAGDRFRFRPVWKEFALAIGLALLIASILLVPVLHGAANITKPANLSNYDQTQPLEYQPLNLVIRDGGYYESGILQKLPWPSQTINYIGWIPILFAVLALRLIPRSGLRQLVFFLTAIVLIYLLSSALVFKLLIPLAPASLKPLTTIARFPSLAASLAVPFILAIAAWGLDLLLQGKGWPRLKLRLTPKALVSISLAWLVLVPLVWSVKSVYDFVQPMLNTYPVPMAADRSKILSQVKPADTQWVESPLGYWGFDILALENGIKLTNVIHNWGLKGRTPPPPFLQVTDDAVDPSRPGFAGEFQFLGLIYVPDYPVFTETLYRFSYPENSYTLVDTGSGRIPCRAAATGGNIEVDCLTDVPGQLVVYENAWTGWGVRRDGLRAALGAGQWLTTQAPAGQHHYSFRYRPWDVPLGGGLSLLGLGLSVWLWFRRPKKAGRSKTS